MHQMRLGLHQLSAVALRQYITRQCTGAVVTDASQPAAIAGDTTAPTVPRLINNFKEVGEVNAHLQSGSLVGYIHEVFGLGAVRAIWQRGAAVIPEVTGMELPAGRHNYFFWGLVSTL